MWLKGFIWSLLIQLVGLGICEASITPSLEPKYRVNYLHTSIPEYISSEIVSYKNDSLAGSFEILNIGSDKNVKYLCYIPPYLKVDQENEDAINNSISLNDKMIKKSAITKISDTFSTRDCWYFNGINTGSYWTFGYCFGDKIIQFHEDIVHFIATKEHKAEYPDYVYVLGRFDDTSNIDVNFENQSKWNQSMLSENDFEIMDDSAGTISPGTASSPSYFQKMIKHTLRNGTICDLTGKPRSIDLIYKCDPQYLGAITIIDFVEIKTCQYQLILNIPTLCQIDEFRPNDVKDEVIDIDCRIVSSSEVQLEDNYVGTDIFFNYDELVVKKKNEFVFDLFDKVTVSDYFLTPLGMSFYVGVSKDSMSPQTHEDRKIILLYNNKYESLVELVSKLGESFAAALGKRINSPIKNDKAFTPLNWEDTFILWIELYDYLGSIIGFSRIERNGDNEEHNLIIQIINTDNMIDQDGDKVVPPIINKLINGWGYEKFMKAGTKNEETNNFQMAESNIERFLSSTVTITVTKSELIQTSTEINNPPSQEAESNGEELELFKLEHDEL